MSRERRPLDHYTAPSPSVAIERGLCPMCLGQGRTFAIVLGRLHDCSGCGGSGKLEDMIARACDDPDCPEHGRDRP